MRLGYRPALDGVRALAITFVVLRHAIGFPAAGALGVDIFFVLSGFLITSLLLDERLRYGAVSLRNFYRRRALRLLPALVVVLAFFLSVSLLAFLRHGTSLAKPLFGVIAGLGYFTNIALTTEAGVATMPNSLTHLWSLAAEEQFYIVWPAVLFVVLRARLHLATVVLAVALALMTAQQLRLYLDGTWWPRLEYGIDTRSTSILVGCLLAVLLATGARPTVERIGRIVGPVGVGALLLLVFVDLGKTIYAGPLLVAGLASAVLIVRALDDASWVARGLSLPPLVFLGRISYSLYLWHIPILSLFGVLHPNFAPMVVPALATALACATASHYFVERPFLRRKKRFEAHSDSAPDVEVRGPAISSPRLAPHAEAAPSPAA
jgi:peptidoglycan/LPS O-acetylase OafA/YrhL